ncbi:MAG: SDR family oxidoreductase [Verrucomicrobia bacterium]|nr:SDR family oxidoreductase [Kiritimatiellia bacterium]MCB1100944.1 SDR family oxidoreductase [Kiritimatiellia bacterium]MCP5489123.1 SDR family oxidoreductase [Verrucomicrobiota bacterium]
MNPTQSVMLITGTRKGIGKFLVEYYTQRGYLVEGCSRETPDWTCQGYHHHCTDVADEAGVQAMMNDIRKRQGRLDILINNAGIASMNHCLLTPIATAERIFRTNFIGSFLLLRESAKLMKKNRYGRIVNMGTVATPMKLEGESMYAASKAAVVNMTQVLAHELAPFGVTCNVVGPTPIETDLIRGVPKQKIQAILDRLAVKRLGHFEDVTNVIDFFIRPESDYITGQVVYLGGV